MQEISDLSADAPYLPEWFFKHVFVPLVEAKRVQLKGAKWLQAEDDIFYLGDGPSMRNHRITISHFRVCSACLPHS